MAILFQVFILENTMMDSYCTASMSRNGDAEATLRQRAGDKSGV